MTLSEAQYAKQKKLESKFISHIITESSYCKALECGFEPRLIQTDEYSDVVGYIKRHYDRYRVTPNPERVKEKYPDVFIPKPEENTSITLILDELKSNYVYSNYQSKLLELGKLIRQTDSKSSDDKLLSLDQIKSLTSQLSQSLDVFSDKSSVASLHEDDFAKSYIDKLKDRRDKKGLLGLPYPWPTVNMHTLGMQDSQLIVTIARPKVGKTWIQCAQVDSCMTHIEENTLEYLEKGRTNIVVISNEITTDEMMDRIVSINRGIPYTKIRSGNLDDNELASLQAELESLQARKCKLYVCGTDGMGVGGTSYVETLIRKYQPAIVFVDGAYLMKSDNNETNPYLRAGSVARTLKIIAKSYRIPVAITWQFNRQVKESDEGSFNDIGMSDALAQDCDVMLTISASNDMKINHRRKIASPGSRACPPFSINTQFSLSPICFDEIPEVDNDDYVDLEQVDVVNY